MGMKIRSIRKRDIDSENEKIDEEYSYSGRVTDHRRVCLKNNEDFVDKMIDDELKEIKTYKIFEKGYSYENPYKIDESTSVSDDVKIITGK